jgi:hypothetical protein
MPPNPELPQELWDEVTSYLPCLSASNAAKAFKFTLQAYDKAWSAVFRTEEWQECNSSKGAVILLIGADLDILGGAVKNPTRLHLVLMAIDRAGDLQWESNLLRSSLCRTYSGPGEYQLEQLTLTVGNFDVPEIFGEDFRYLFSKDEEQLQTKYCYWNDPEKLIRVVEQTSIRGLGGVITEARDLCPIFCLHLYPPKRRYQESDLSRPRFMPEQFIFRSFGGYSFWTGRPPLVDVILGPKSDAGEYIFEGFTFRNDEYENLRYKNTEWEKVAEAESGHDCTMIT